MPIVVCVLFDVPDDSKVDELKYAAAAAVSAAIQARGVSILAGEPTPLGTVVVPPLPAPQPIVLYSARLTANLNVRDKPSTVGSTILRTAMLGTVWPVYEEMAVAGTGYAWLKIAPAAQEWVSGKYAVRA